MIAHEKKKPTTWKCLSTYIAMSSCEKRPPHRRHSKIGWPLWEGLRTVYCGRSNGFNADRAWPW